MNQKANRGTMFMTYLGFWLVELVQLFWDRPIRSQTIVFNHFLITIPLMLTIASVLFLVIHRFLTQKHRKLEGAAIGIILAFTTAFFAYDSIRDYQLRQTSQSLDSICLAIDSFEQTHKRLPNTLNELLEEYPKTSSRSYFDLSRSGLTYRLDEVNGYILDWKTEGQCSCNCDSLFLSNMKYTSILCYTGDYNGVNRKKQ